jgi:hypothetical protein
MKFFLRKRDRRLKKNVHVRKAIDENRKAAEEVRKLTSELVATLNGDKFWMDVKAAKKEREKEVKNGLRDDCVSGNTG